MQQRATIKTNLIYITISENHSCIVFVNITKKKISRTHAKMQPGSYFDFEFYMHGDRHEAFELKFIVERTI